MWVLLATSAVQHPASRIISSERSKAPSYPKLPKPNYHSNLWLWHGGRVCFDRVGVGLGVEGRLQTWYVLGTAQGAFWKPAGVFAKVLG